MSTWNIDTGSRPIPLDLELDEGALKERYPALDGALRRRLAEAAVEFLKAHHIVKNGASSAGAGENAVAQTLVIKGNGG